MLNLLHTYKMNYHISREKFKPEQGLELGPQISESLIHINKLTDKLGQYLFLAGNLCYRKHVKALLEKNIAQVYQLIC